MAILSDSLIYDLIVLVVVLGFGLYKFFTSTFSYWKDRGVAYLEPLPFVGNLKDQLLGLKGPNDMYQSFYDQMKTERYFGFYEIRAPVLMIKDPHLVSQVLVKDFNHFYDRGLPSDGEFDPLSASLFNLEGKQWRNLRYKLTPTFTTGKLKGMFEQICNCGEGLVKCIEEQSKTNKAVEGKPLLADFAFEVIASVAFGLQLDKDNEDTKNFRKVMEVLISPKRTQLLRFFAVLYMPKVARKVGIKQFPGYVEDVVMQLVRQTLHYRIFNNVQRNDFLQLLLNIQKQEKDGTLNFQKDLDHSPEDDVIDQMEHVAKEDDEDNPLDKQKAFMTEPVIAAQSFVFLTAGSESISSTVNFALYSLTQNPEIQQKVHDELDSVLARNNNKWSYQAVKEMTYLEQVIEETLRLYPVAAFLFRKCTKTYKVPDTDLVIEKGVRVIIPVRGIHTDPANYDSPEVFDPDRFQENNFKPSGTYLPFGDGPRICIAMRFAALEVKMVLARILASYKVKLSPKTKLPLTFKTNSFLLAPANSFWYEFDKRAKV